MLSETKPISIDYTMYDIIYITYLKCQNYRNVEKMVQRLRMEGIKGHNDVGVVMKGKQWILVMNYILTKLVDTQT